MKEVTRKLRRILKGDLGFRRVEKFMTKLKPEDEKKPACAEHVRGGKLGGMCAEALGQEGVCMLWNSLKGMMAGGHKHKVRVAQKGMQRDQGPSHGVWIFLKMKWEVTEGI